MNSYDQHRAECRPCRELGPKWAGGKPVEPPGPPKPFELIEGLAEEIRNPVLYDS